MVEVEERIQLLQEQLIHERARHESLVDESRQLVTQLQLSADALSEVWTRTRLLRERLALATSVSPSGTFHWHAPSARLLCDDRVAGLYDLSSRTEMTVQHLVDGIHVEDRTLMQASWNQCVELGTPFQLELRRQRASGGLRWLSVAATGFDCVSSGARCVVGACADTTPSHLAPQAEVPQLVWVAAPDGRVEYVNEPWAEVTGRPVRFDDASALHGLFHEQDQFRIRERWLSAVARGETLEVEGRIVGANREARWFVVRAVPMHGPGGVILRWVGTCTCIDAQRRAPVSPVASFELGAPAVADV